MHVLFSLFVLCFVFCPALFLFFFFLFSFFSFFFFYFPSMLLCSSLCTLHGLRVAIILSLSMLLFLSSNRLVAGAGKSLV